VVGIIALLTPSFYLPSVFLTRGEKEKKGKEEIKEKMGHPPKKLQRFFTSTKASHYRKEEGEKGKEQ